MTAPVVFYIGSGPWPDPAAVPAGHASGDGAGPASGPASSPVPHPVSPDKMRGGDPVQRPGISPRPEAPADVPLAPPVAGRPVLDPFRIHHEFPDRWSAYIRAHFRGIAAVIAAFGVSERTARKWWDGENGANGGNVAVAVALHPETAPQMLFDRAA